MTSPLYLDYNATTPVAPEVADAIEPYLREHFGTPSSSHAHGRRAHEAVELAQRRLPAVTERLRARRDALHRSLSAAIPGLVLNGHPEERLPNTLHLSFPGTSGRELLARTPSVATSVGSACHEEGDGVSDVLGAMGVGSNRAMGAVRLSISEPTTDDEIRQTADDLVSAWSSLPSS